MKRFLPTTLSSKLNPIPVYVALLVLLISGSSSVYAQISARWPTPTVALYDCDCSGAIVDSASSLTLLSSVSSRIYRLVAHDAAGGGVILMHLGTADTLANDIIAESNPNVFVKDSTLDRSLDYILGAKLTGSSGSYQLSIFLLDSYNLDHVADGTASFGTVSAGTLDSAVSAALSGLFPLQSKIRSYQVKLRNNDPSLTINPGITFSRSLMNLQPGGTASVTLTLVDCDSAVLAGRTLTLTAEGGSVSPQSVQTDAQGQATVSFQAGSNPSLGAVVATLSGGSAVTHRSTSTSNSTPVVVGNVDLTSEWKVDFSLRYTYLEFSDTIVTDQATTSWYQASTTMSATAGGSGFVNMEVDSSGFIFSGPDSLLWAISRKFTHSLSLTSSVTTGQDCPQDPWEMSGTTENGINFGDSVGFPGASYTVLNGKVYSTVETFEFFDGASSYSDWKRYNTKVNSSCQRQSSYQLASTGVAPLIFANDQSTGTRVIFLGPIDNPSGITVLVDYNVDTVTYDITQGAVYQHSSTSFQIVFTPLTRLTDVKSNPPALPEKFALLQNYPNPFNPTTAIAYHLPASSRVSLKVYDVLGRLVADLANGVEKPGNYTVRFDGSRLPSGVYFYRLNAEPIQATGAGDFSKTEKMVLVK